MSVGTDVLLDDDVLDDELADVALDDVVGSVVGAVGVTVGVMMVELGVGAEVGDIGGVSVVLGASDVGVEVGRVLVGETVVGPDVDVDEGALDGVVSVDGTLEDDVLDVGTGLTAVGPGVPGVVGTLDDVDVAEGTVGEGTQGSVGRLGTRAASDAPAVGITHGTGCTTDLMSLVE